MSELKYSNVWMVLGLGWVALVVYLSVTNLAVPQVEIGFGDKINHFIAYGFLMGWFGQLLKRWRHRYVLMVGLVCLGVAMELVQGLLPHRWFDPFDAAANACGVLIGAAALYVGADNILLWVERKIS